MPDCVTFPHHKEFLGPSSILCKMVRTESEPKTLYNAWGIGVQEMLAKSEYLLTSVDFKPREEEKSS